MNVITLPEVAKARKINGPERVQMAKCFMCGSPISHGILCDKCDKPKRPKAPAAAKPKADASPSRAPEPPSAPQPPVARETPLSSPAAGAPRSAAATAAEVEPDPFPKAPIVPFPIEAATPALTSVVSILVAAGVPAILLGSDRTVKFVSDEARHLFDAAPGELMTIRMIEERTGLRIGDLSIPASAGLQLRNASILYSLVPLSGGAAGAVIVLRYADPASGRTPFVTYVRETVLGPLKALRDSLIAASRMRAGGDPLLTDSAATLDQVLSSLELAPEVGGTSDEHVVPTVTDVVHRVSEKFRAFADLKGIQLQVDVQELEERFRDSDQLTEALGILMDNALHYVPAGGQVVIGVRWMEHKGKPLLLFFVMDNGPLVPEALRTAIFEPSFVWSPQSAERTGRSLFRTREFAVAHSGSVWVESKTGKACTFFLRVRPDAAS